MPTDFLNRRMDLIHECDSTSFVDPFGNIVGGEGDNFLTMDTSYPVKLAGKVIKLFTADDQYTEKKFTIRNSNKETILEINANDIYDFAGRVINDNIGEGKSYEHDEDVYKAGDYVMAIIDFDNNSLHLCSQTNFQKFITGGVEGEKETFKLFNISGTEKIEGFDFPIDTNIFDSAYEFELNGEDNHAFLRHDNDDVVYQVPGISDNNNRNMIPVASVKNMNINKLNVSVSQLTFPFINIASGTSCGVDNVSGIMSYFTINGEVNDEFIDKYCFTNTELTNLAFFKELTSVPENQIRTEYDKIPDNKKNDYVYVIRSRNGNNKYSDEIISAYILITAINKTTKKFNNFLNFSNKGICCDGTSVSIQISDLSSYNLIGNFWGEINDGFYFYYYDSSNNVLPYRINITKNGKNNIINSNNLCYSDFVNNVTSYMTNMINTSFVFISNEMKKIDRFIKFFSNNDVIYYNAIKNRTLMMPVSYDGFIPAFYNTTTNSRYTQTPMCIVAIYPDAFSNVLFDKNGESFTHNSENIHTFKSFYNDEVTDEFDRKSYKFPRHNIVDHNKFNYTLAYELFDFNNMSGYYKEYDSYTFANISNIQNSELKKYKYITNIPLQGNSFSHTITKTLDNKTIMYDIISKVMVNCINTPYYTSETAPSYNNSELTVQNFIVTKEISQAKDYISIDSNDNNRLYYHPNGIIDDTKYPLYIVCNNNSNIFTMEYANATNNNFKLTNTSQTNLCYMYYVNNNQIHRIKYYFDGTNESTTDINIKDFDYFVDAEIFNKNMTDNLISYNIYAKAFINQYMNNNSSSKDDAIAKFREYCDFDDICSKVIIDVISSYHFYPYIISNESDIVMSYSSADYGTIYTPQLTIGVDEKIYYPCKVNNPELNNGSGYHLKDMLDEDAIYYQNSLVPYVSDKKDNNGTYIYSLKNYISFIKNHKVEEFYNTAMFKYLNGIGIREEYYKDKSIYEFYNNILSKDLSKPVSNIKYLDITNTQVFFTKDMIRRIKGYKREIENDQYVYKYIDSNGNVIPLTTQYDNGMTLNANIDTTNIFGFNDSTLKNYQDEDITEEYTSDEKINMNVIETGLRKVYSIAIGDNNINPSILSIHGVIDDISVDDLNWNTLLLALNNDKSIDILSKSLLQIKKEINDYIINTAQNVNDSVSLATEIALEENANKHDGIFDPQETYPDYWKEKNAEFDDKHNLYNFNYGYGFGPFDENFNSKRILDNRGVIVFVSEGGILRRHKTNSVGETPDQYTYSYDQYPEVYPKRMYISKDGLLCTKEYFDREAATSEDTLTTIKALEEKIKSLEERIAVLENK